MKDKISKKKKVLKGVVVSDKMDKTAVVAVDSLKTHSKYLKKYRVTKKYNIHDPENKAKVGEKVEFIESKPISKSKKFEII